jgi:hypothetical protein
LINVLCVVFAVVLGITVAAGLVLAMLRHTKNNKQVVTHEFGMV